MRKLVVFVLVALGLLLVVPAAALASPKIFYVSPSKTGDDTANIQAAFTAAVKAGPGSTVQLTAGHFYTNAVFVRGFSGSFRGAGEGKTVIDTLRGIDPSAAPLGPVTLDNSGNQVRPGPRCTVSRAAACASRT